MLRTQSEGANDCLLPARKALLAEMRNASLRLLPNKSAESRPRLLSSVGAATPTEKVKLYFFNSKLGPEPETKWIPTFFLT